MDAKQLRTFRYALAGVMALAYLACLVIFSIGNLQGKLVPWEVVANTLLTSVPLIVLFGTAVLLGWVALGRAAHPPEPMHPRAAAFLYWSPRVAGIAMAVMIGAFALDVFDLPGTWWQLALAFLGHALPAIVLAGVVALAWRWEWVGALGFLLAALAFLGLMQGMWTLVIVMMFIAPLAALSVLFWANWRWKQEIRQAKAAA